jgi:signal transduction histidine kinase
MNNNLAIEKVNAVIERLEAQVDLAANEVWDRQVELIRLKARAADAAEATWKAALDMISEIEELQRIAREGGF